MSKKQVKNSSNPDIAKTQKEILDEYNKKVNEINKKRKNRHLVVNFPDLLDYKETLSFGSKYLLMVGGSKLVVEACIDFIKELGFRGVKDIECFSGEAENGKLKDEIVGSVHAFMSVTKYVVRKQNKMKNKRNFSHEGLVVLRNISSANNDMWNELTLDYREGISKPDFLIATTSLSEVEKLPKSWVDLFETVSLDEQVTKSVAELTDSEEQHKSNIEKLFSSGCKWVDIEITFIDNETVKIKVGSENIRRGYLEMGFENRKTKKPDRAWYRLKLFALQNGTITHDFNKRLKGNDDYYVKPKDIESINKKLRSYVKVIEGNPIPHYKRKGNCYKIKLKHIGVSDNLRKHMKGELYNKLKEGNINDDEYFRQRREDNYKSSNFSDEPEDNPRNKGNGDD